MLIDILKSFLPWILYFFLLGPSQLQMDAAVIVGAVTSIVFELKPLKKGFILSWGTLIFFIFMFIAVVVIRIQSVIQYGSLISHAGLATIATASILLRRPFTIQYAKLRVGKEKWNHPVFLRINYILTTLWLIVFLIGVGLNIYHIKYPSINAPIFEIVTYLPSIIGVWVTTWFPDWYRARLKRITKCN